MYTYMESSSAAAELLFTLPVSLRIYVQARTVGESLWFPVQCSIPSINRPMHLVESSVKFPYVQQPKGCGTCYLLIKDEQYCLLVWVEQDSNAWFSYLLLQDLPLEALFDQTWANG